MKISCDTHIPPPNVPGLLPRWFSDRNVQPVIAGGMESRDVSPAGARWTGVITGVPACNPADILHQYPAGIPLTGTNTCDHLD